MERIFLGWDAPMLPKAVDWLLDRLTDLDLSGVLVVVPGRRAGRRLTELLVQAADQREWQPPTIVTPGDLPEYLYQSRQQLATPLECLLARGLSLRQADRPVLEQVVPHPPGQGDLIGWLTLADEFNQLHATLAGENVQAGQIPQRLAGLIEFDDQQRWQALAGLEAAYQQVLAGWDRIDAHQARRQAIDDQTVSFGGHVVLVGVSDLPAVLGQMLEQLSQSSPVTALIHAPQQQQAGFDALGGLVPGYWEARSLPLPADRVVVVDRPRDQADAVVAAIAQTSQQGLIQAVDQVTVGVGDPLLMPAVQRALELAGLPARSAVGLELTASRPATLLAALGQYLSRRQLDTLASLLRHPDLEQWLLEQPGVAQATAAGESEAGGNAGGNAGGGWLQQLDDYAAEHLCSAPPGPWLGGDEAVAALRAACDALHQLLPEHPHRALPLPEQAHPLAAILASIYDTRPLRRYDRADEPVIEALGRAGQLLREWVELDAQHPAVPRVTLSEAISLLLHLAGRQPLSVPGGQPAVELLGWLELQADDAELLVIAGMNEGFVPQSADADAFLPDTVRRALGLLDNQRRYARDRMMLEAMLTSRPMLRLIAGRMTAKGDPLLPSRLLLADDPQHLPQRVLMFYQSSHDRAMTPISLPATVAASGADAMAYRPPLPIRPDVPISRMRVTSFRDYLACPYRFYLKHVLRLKQADDRVAELDSLHFGSVAHDVLDCFGQSDRAAATDPQVIDDFLQGELDNQMRSRFGRSPAAVVTIQQRLLARRLTRFAHWQAQQNQAGWRILPQYIERDLEGALDLPQEPFIITGRIDRIDEHPEHGYRVIDYKTGDTGQSPEKVHRTGPRDARRWCDLQLPLYRALITGMGLSDPIQLGYVLLPKDDQKAGLALAGWSDEDLDDAMQLARQVAANVRQGIFWPLGDAPTWPDGFEAICMDGDLARSRVIRQQSEVTP